MKRGFYRAVLFLDGVALALAGVALVDFLLHPLAGDAVFNSVVYRALVIVVLTPLTLLVGFLIMRRVPGNVVGPLLIVWSGTVAYWSIRADIAPGLFAFYYYYDMVFGWLGFFLMLLHFPDGSIYPQRAAPWVYRQLGLNVAMSSLVFLSAATLEVPSQMANPFHLSALQKYADLFLGLAVLLALSILVITLVSSVLHYRQGSQAQRRQIKWLALFAAINVSYVVVGLIAYPLLTGGEVMSPGFDPIAIVFYLFSGLFPLIAIGIGVLRHHLWDIDLIIRRTLVYSILTVILSLIYFGSVAGLQSLFTAVIGHQSRAAIVLSTLAIVVSFTPLRKRIQERIDRRFYRHRYDAGQVLATFSTILREEVDLDRLTNSIVGVVEETMRPAHISSWLREMERESRERWPEETSSRSFR